jgi:hypothetical protein
VQRMPIDESMAFTALLEMDPHFRNLSSAAGTVRRDALLKAWYAQDEVRNMWAFARKWLEDEKKAVGRFSQPDPVAEAAVRYHERQYPYGADRR